MASQAMCQRLATEVGLAVKAVEPPVGLGLGRPSFMPKVRQVMAVSTQASTPKISQPTAAFHCNTTMPLASTPLRAIPAPGPVNIRPPRLLALRSASLARHQPDVKTNTKALATPAAKRSHGHNAGTCSAIPSVNTQVATRPPRSQVVDATSGSVLKRDQISG